MTFTDALRKLSQALFFPQGCVICHEWVLNADFSPLCRSCFSSFERLDPRVCYCCGIPIPGNVLDDVGSCSQCRLDPPPFDFARAYGPYEGRLRRTIRKFKFEGFQRLAYPLGELLETCYRQTNANFTFDCILPVPLHRRRKRERGFDQTLLLSRALARRLGVPVFRGLRRVKYTIPQFGLEIQERRRNIRGAFALKSRDLPAGRNVLVVDDVMTTGTTVGEICTLLRSESNVKTIGVFAVARAPLLYCKI